MIISKAARDDAQEMMVQSNIPMSLSLLDTKARLIIIMHRFDAIVEGMLMPICVLCVI